MFIVVAVTILALVAAYSLSKWLTDQEFKMSEPPAQMLTIGVQIICGDCSGDAESPIKTYLNRVGDCAQCGGRSYMLASSRVVYAQQVMLKCLQASETANSLLPVEARTELYTVRSQTLTA